MVEQDRPGLQVPRVQEVKLDLQDHLDLLVLLESVVVLAVRDDQVGL